MKCLKGTTSKNIAQIVGSCYFHNTVQFCQLSKAVIVTVLKWATAKRD